MRRALPVLALALASTAASAAGAGGPSVSLTRPLPQVVRQGGSLVARGHYRGLTVRCEGLCAYVSAELQARRVYGAGAHPWQRLGSRHFLGELHGFTLRWTVPRHYETGPLSVRVALLLAGRVAATTPASSVFVGPAPVYCTPPPPIMQDIPVGDGWIVGGSYIAGGPFPGFYQCVSQDYTVTATGQAGGVVTSQNVAGGHSYAIVLPAGQYTLKSSSCGTATATVTAARQTHADVVCPVP